MDKKTYTVENVKAAFIAGGEFQRNLDHLAINGHIPTPFDGEKMRKDEANRRFDPKLRTKEYVGDIVVLARQVIYRFNPETAELECEYAKNKWMDSAINTAQFKNAHIDEVAFYLDLKNNPYDPS